MTDSVIDTAKNLILEGTIEFPLGIHMPGAAVRSNSARCGREQLECGGNPRESPALSFRSTIDALRGGDFCGFCYMLLFLHGCNEAGFRTSLHSDLSQPILIVGMRDANRVLSRC